MGKGRKKFSLVREKARNSLASEESTKFSHKSEKR